VAPNIEEQLTEVYAVIDELTEVHTRLRQAIDDAVERLQGRETADND
jgi:hypothetical protein